MAYIDISIVAPSSEEEGNRVSASVRVKNITEYHYSFKATIYAVPDLYRDYVIGSIDQIIMSGSSVTRSATFTMPDCNTTVFVWVERWAFDHWAYVGSKSKVVSLEIPVPEYKGIISRKELEYDGSQETIPVSNVPQDTEGRVHVYGQNNMATSQKLGVHFIVKDPDGLVVQDYEDWEFGTTPPDDDHHFYGPRFDIDKGGAWTIAIGLTMNPNSPINVDIYAGVLCTVAPEIYTGTISRKELDYDGARGIIPVY